MHLFRNCGLACSAVPGGGFVGVIQLPHERISERRIELEYGPRISWRLARADHSQGEFDDAEDGVGSPPAEAAPAVPAEQSSLVAFAAVGAGTTGYCQPLDIATMRVFKLKQILHHVMTILWKTVVCTRLRPGRQLSARAVSVLPDLDGEPPLFSALLVSIHMVFDHFPIFLMLRASQEVRPFHRVQENTPRNMNDTYTSAQAQSLTCAICLKCPVTVTCLFL